MNHVTTQKYAGVFESLFLIRTLAPWYTNALKRLTKTPKLHFLDAGLSIGIGLGPRIGTQ
jgi:uncharacterized protein